MATLTWRPEALKDLERIEAYFKELAPNYASTIVRELLERSEALLSFPRMGRMVPEVGDEALRELIHLGFRIMYVLEPESDSVVILTVLHSTRQFGAPDSSGA